MGADGLGAGAVARRLGVAVTTLRTWHQRYGLGPSHHVAGRHRRYTEDDVARLEVMQRLTARGVAPVEAARWAARAAAGGPVVAGDRSTADAGAADRPGVAARGLTRAALRLDATAMRELVEQSVAQRGVVTTWDTVVRPVLVGIGERHAATSAFVEVEHLVSRTVSEVFGAVARPRDAAPTILLACADEEQHSLPLEALAAALAEAGVPSRLLGARVPATALRDAVDRTGPDAVVLWAHLPETGDPAQLTTLLAGGRRPPVVAAAGPGWRADRLPEGVARPGSLAEALALTAPVSGRTAAQRRHPAGHR